MAQQTVSNPGVFTADAVTKLNANFTDLYAGGGSGSLASPAITGTVTGGASYTAPTLTSPTITGTTAIGAGATLTSPTLVTPALGAATGTSVVLTGGVTVVGGAQFITTNTALTNTAAAQTATMTNGPTAGNPTKWIQINDNGTLRSIPAW
jgi:hypothetical protein